MDARRRIALISDIHGNAIALRAVLRSIEREGVDEIVCLGDVATLGVGPSEVVDTLRELGCRCIVGNHDDYLLDPRLVDSHCEGTISEAIAWGREQLSNDQMEFLSRFEAGITLSLGTRHRLMLYHGSPSSNTVDLLADTPAAEFDQQLGPDRATVMAGGHTHIQMLRQHRGSLVINPGSVGAPFLEFPVGGRPTILGHAEYATVDVVGESVAVGLHRVALDRTELASAARASSNPMGAELAAPYLP
ncbi:MAG: metallophosphoesterase family protein [Myxococcota bacterium]